MGMLSSEDRAGSAAPCDDGPGADLCQPRVRTGLLVVSESGRACEVALLAAERLQIACVHHGRVGDAVDHLTGARVSCVVLDASGPEPEPMSALARIKAARSDVPIVVLGADGNSMLALAAVRAGAQDYLVRDEVDAGSLERSIRYAIERKRTEVQLAHVAVHDHLTGLPNRSVFDDCLELALQRRRNGLGDVAVLFIDLDDFKRLNDSFGHNAGDDVLREAAARIRSAVRPHDTVARLGGDEFTVLCEGVQGDRGALTIGRRIAEELARPLVIQGHELVVRASIGVALAQRE